MTRPADKEIYDPVFHYVRGILHYENHAYHFTAYRQPYIELNEKSWRSIKSFRADYQKVVIRKYRLEPDLDIQDI